MAVARRFAVGGYRVTLVARSSDNLRDLAGTLADIGAKISTIAADASDPEGLGARMRELYAGDGAPGVIVYNAVMGAPDRLLSSSAAHLQEAYSVDVIGAIVVAQVAAPALRAAGFGTILVTGGGFADHPIPALATVSLGKAALRSAATMLREFRFVCGVSVVITGRGRTCGDSVGLRRLPQEARPASPPTLGTPAVEAPAITDGNHRFDCP